MINEVGNKFVVDDSISAPFWLYARPVTWLILPLVQKKNEPREQRKMGLGYISPFGIQTERFTSLLVFGVRFMWC
jgi:hypothetical protein